MGVMNLIVYLLHNEYNINLGGWSYQLPVPHPYAILNLQEVNIIYSINQYYVFLTKKLF